MNLLKQAALSFERLKEIKYRMVLSAGLNKPLEEIVINFYDEDLFHILILIISLLQSINFNMIIVHSYAQII